MKWLQTKNLIPLLHAVFNKVFTQLHIIRKKSFKLNEDEHLSDIAKRFEYLVINAFASFMKDGIISHANPALTADVSTISNEENFKKRDRVLTKNIEGLVIFDSKKEVKNDRIASLLLSAIWNHPLFKNNNVSSPIFKIGSRQQFYTFDSIKSNVMKRYKNFSVVTLNDWVKVQKRPTLEKMLDGLRLDDLFWNYKNEEGILKMNKREEFPRLYQIIYDHIQDVNKKK